MSATTHPHGPLFNGSESSYPPQNQEPSPTRRGLLRNPIRYWVGWPVFSRQVSLPDRAWADHITRVKVMVKVLDFVQSGGAIGVKPDRRWACRTTTPPPAPSPRSVRLRRASGYRGGSRRGDFFRLIVDHGPGRDCATSSPTTSTVAPHGVSAAPRWSTTMLRSTVQAGGTVKRRSLPGSN